MSIAQLFGFKSDKHVAAKLAAVETHQVSGKLRGRLAALKKKEGGFTLLELLVVVAILAAVAGTATIILRDTDRQASAAAHVAMMDELSKGILTYRVLNNGLYPDNFDSLFANATNDLNGVTITDFAEVINDDLAGSLTVVTLNADRLALLNDYGIEHVRIIDPASQAGGCSAANIKALINDRGNNVVNGNIFRAQFGTLAGDGGCGYAADYELTDTDTVAAWDTSAASGGDIRIKATTGQVIYAFGIGPDSTLFSPDKRGALNNVPTYRHVTQEEYNRFVALLGENPITHDLELYAIIDGAGDTKDEELGEWDGTRSTL
jgi:prepilin-type N-terminal cleavage/methylation domain-containing protein